MDTDKNLTSSHLKYLLAIYEESQDKIDVSAIAAKFGGGGHKNASGMSCNGKVETLIPQVVKEFARVM